MIRGKGPVITLILQDTHINCSKVMDKLVILTLLLATAVRELQTKNILSGHENVNEVNHIQVGVYYQNKLEILPWFDI